MPQRGTQILGAGDVFLPKKIRVTVRHGPEPKYSIDVIEAVNHIVKAKVYNDKVRFIVALPEKSFYREIVVHNDLSRLSEFNKTVVVLSDEYEQIQRYLNEKVVEV